MDMVENSTQSVIARVIRLFGRPTYGKKFLFFLVGDSICIVASLYVAFLLRFDFLIEAPYARMALRAVPIFLGVKIFCFWLFKLYRLSWRFVSLKDFYNIIKAILLSTALLVVGLYFLRIPAFEGFPRSILAIDAFVTLVCIASFRIAKRAFLEVIRGRYRHGGKPTIIVGAGNTGEMILRDMQRLGFRPYAPVLFLDDDPNRVGMYLHGIRVAGDISDLARFISLYRITAVMIAIPSLTHARLRTLYKTAKDAGVQEIKIVPPIYAFHRPEIRVQELEDIKIEDLIGRQAVEVDYKEIGRSLEDKTILVTGAGGSIGFELVNQLCTFNPRALVLFEIDETELYHAEIALKRNHPEYSGKLHLIVGDVRDRDRVEQVFARLKPDLVFHAAAYKHVPMMEYNAEEAVKVNIIGTAYVARAARTWGAERFIMISTDKAVRPSSIMGATKRVAENICRALQAGGKTEYLSVRFGNVLGSRGSVLPLFLEQIAKGESLTVTHQDMLRYFMTIPEAVLLVLQASVMGRGGDVMVLDMGKPVKIIELAEELLRLHDLEPYKDVDISIIGLRPGEKLFEEILTAEEGTIATRHEKIFVARTDAAFSLSQMEEVLERFQRTATLLGSDDKEIRSLLKQYVRWYEGASREAVHQTAPNLVFTPLQQDGRERRT